MNTETAAEPRKPVNYVFVDYENVPGVDLSCIGEKAAHVTLLLGARQTKLDVTLAQKLMAHAASTQLIRLEKEGKNALDFTLAFYLGRAVQMDPEASFHVVSKDGGYDNLIEHLQKKHIRIHKHADDSRLTFEPGEAPKTAAPKPSAKAPTPVQPSPKANPFAQILQHLRKQGDKKPKTRKKLMSDIKSHQGRDTTDTQVEKLVLKLEKDGHVSFDEKGRATYQLKR